MHKDKLRNICDEKRLTFLQNKLNQFKHKTLNMLSPSLSEIWNTEKQ